MEELEKCPFCGGEANIRYIAVMEAPYYPECTNKHCIAGDTNIGFKTEKEAAEAWNKRV